MSLDRTPAAELLGQTAQVWADALWPGRAWYADSDVSRIAEGFRRLTGVVRQWPAPADLLTNLPAREPSKLPALPSKVETEADRQRGMRHISEILTKIMPKDVQP